MNAKHFRQLQHARIFDAVAQLLTSLAAVHVVAFQLVGAGEIKGVRQGGRITVRVRRNKHQEFIVVAVMVVVIVVILLSCCVPKVMIIVYDRPLL